MSFWKKIARSLGSAAKTAVKGFSNVTTSPAWTAIAAGVNVVPGLGSAVSVGMLAASKVGKAVASTDGIVAAVRDQLPGGDAMKAGFDAAIGVAAKGKGITGEGLQVIRAQLPSGPARAGFDAGLALHVGRRTAPPPPSHLSPAGKGAYYATRGVVHVGAPATMKKVVVASAAHSPAAKQGVHVAIATLPRRSRETTWLEWAWHKITGKAA